MLKKRKKATGKATNAVTIAARVRAAKAVELRTQGKTFLEIARALNYNSQQAAHDAVKRSLIAILREPVEHLVSLELERLDRIWGIQFSNAQAGDVQAVAACLKIMERRARLLGLDVQPKIEDVPQIVFEQVVVYMPDNQRELIDVTPNKTD